MSTFLFATLSQHVYLPVAAPISKGSGRAVYLFTTSYISWRSEELDFDFSAIVGNPRVILIDSLFHR